MHPGWAALLLPRIPPVFSVVAPGQPGASPPSVRRPVYEMSSRPALTPRRGVVLLSGVLVLAALVAAPRWVEQSPVEAAVASLPAKLTDQQFWRLSTELSEPGGYFRSDNLVSNEHTFQYVIPTLRRTVRGGVYLGVAPDQNFTYIVTVEPKMAFILDIRRGNLLEHLMYKAIIELSADRADFVSRLFSRKRPPGLGPESTVQEIFEAFDEVTAREDLYRENMDAIEHALVVTHGFTLGQDDLTQLEGIYRQFYVAGPGLRYNMDAGGGAPGAIGRRGAWFGRYGFNGYFPTYEDLVRQTDQEGRPHSYLATEAAFAYLKAFEAKNLLVPVMGDFAGPKALRAIGRYVKAHDSSVSTFYVSNVEQYLFQDGLWTAFYRNVATLPATGSSTFIRSVSSRMGYSGGGQWADGRATALDPIRASVRDFEAGKILTYYDLNARSR